MVKSDAVTRREANGSFACVSGDWEGWRKVWPLEHVETYLDIFYA